MSNSKYFPSLVKCRTCYGGPLQLTTVLHMSSLVIHLESLPPKDYLQEPEKAFFFSFSRDSIHMGQTSTQPGAKMGPLNSVTASALLYLVFLVTGLKRKRGYGHKGERSKSSITCENSNKLRHPKPDCYLKGGGKEGQGPRQRRFNKQREKKPEESVAITKAKDEELFAFTSTSNYHAPTNSLKLPKDKYGACMDSSASDHYRPKRD
jgi:hypothetical protein